MVALSTTAQVEEALRRGAAGRGEQAPLLLDYARMLLEHGPVRFLAALPEAALLDFMAQRFEFAQQRTSQPFALRVSDGPALAGRGGPAFSVVEILVDDRPFLVDSIQSYLVAQDLRIQALLHPILNVRRDPQGHMVAVADYSAGEGTNESHMCFLVDAVPERLRQGLLEELRAILYDVIRCVDDYASMTAHMERIKTEAGADKAARPVSRLMQWFQEGSFIFMGYLPFRTAGGALQPQPEHGLGLFHPALQPAAHHEALRVQVTRFMERAADEAPFFVVEETTIASKMHHRERLTALLISPQPAGGRREAAALVGIFTERSLLLNVLEIPVVEARIAAVLRLREIAPASYKQREALAFLNGLPRFELFRLPEPMLERVLEFFLEVVDQPRTEVALLEDEDSGTARVLVTLPGREFPQAKVQQVRERAEALFNLTAQNVYVVHVSTFGMLALVFYHPAGTAAALPDPAQVDEAIREELLSRDDRLVRLWLSARGSALEERLARTLVEGLPEEYKIAHPHPEILTDLTHLEALAKSDAPQFVLRRAPAAGGVKLVLYGWEKLSLSRVMPIFTNLRVEVEEEETVEVRLPERLAFMHTFLLHPPPGREIDPETHQEPLRQLIFNILQHRSENDPLNALLLSADFDWRQIHLMRLYRNYLMQVGTVYTRSTINETLIRRPRAVRALYQAFHARFDPDLDAREAAQREAREELEEAEREIDNLTEDRIVKGIHNLIGASIRTSFYQDPDDPVIAVKLASADIEQLPSPRPLYEISVYGPLMEGIHLRGDKIARGGIRYSDRPDDFRTEVLGLMATQMKKNALIVPLGSKGGFVVKDLAPYDGNARAAGDAQYRVFIRALLSITDNLTQGRPVPPPRVVRHDDDDPYLVVAADKGTAHLSDTANAVAQEMGFWLADAFASGGSHGYDHKVVGITARGAWESVKRLFWEQGVDVQRDPVTVVGIGDMSGDVFGNGLLSSRTLRLIGAFDHRHIFLDPDPDPEAAYAERERVFRLPRSAWTDYDASLISEGGGIYPRSAKAIPVTPPLRTLLGTEAETLSGEEMIRALLTAPVDLLWNGGIGTYVKSSTESNADVGDPNNDAVRVDANRLRAKVVGEGGNLGFTQIARIEFASLGGGIHTDAIDNAGGVNMSDHEVNLKILFSALIDTGQLAGREARNALLAELEPDVTTAVLRANFRQVLVLSMDRLRSQRNVEPFLRLVDLLAAEGGLDRRTESIPNAQRFQSFQNEDVGVPRPVLAVLLAYTKMLLYRRIVSAELAGDEALERYYRAYFPPSVVQRFRLEEANHPLKRQIVATVVTNRIVDQAGMTFVAELAAFAGRSWVDVVEAYLLADEIVGGPDYREHVYALATTLPAETQYRLLMELEALLAEITRWLLLQPRGEAPLFAGEARRREEFRAYCNALPTLLDAEEKEEMADAIDELERVGMRPEAARLGALVPFLRDYPLVCGLAAQGDIPVPQAFALVACVDERLRFRQLEAALVTAHYGDRMQKRFGDGLLRTVELQRRAKLTAVLEQRGAGEPAEWLEAWLTQRQGPWSAYEATLRQVLAVDRPELVALAVVIGQLEGV
ncbi:MAG TPA: NAD-glutamate dehydrogenase domain-containing protein [bacterium]|nr:NAD-glutamate dehydrogenase domain-containing protein [bacterium]